MIHPLDGIPKPRFASDAVDALACHADLLRTTLALSNRPYVPTGTTVDFLNRSEADKRDWRTFCADLPVYFWSKAASELVTQASHSYPLKAEPAICLDDVQNQMATGVTPEVPAYFPRVAHALCVFERPTLFMRDMGQDYPLSAIGWNVAVNQTVRSLWLCLRGIEWRGSFAVPCWWSDGGTAAQPGDDSSDPTFQTERLAFAKWVCAASMFIEQHVLIATRVNFPRQIVRMAQRENRALPTCHVVTLRRFDTSGIGESDSDGLVEWSHRWLVRGHWRNQFFPKLGSHAPIWIHPHVKGPEDKPFREPLQTVYAVRR